MMNSTERVADPRVVEQDEWIRRADFRARCRKSLWFLTKTVICADESPNLLTERTFKESSKWLQRVLTHHKRALFEDPRNHTKSYRSTKAIPVWVGIQRPHVEYDHPEEVDRVNAFLKKHTHIKGPDTRIVIGSETSKKAGKWVDASRRVWEHNAMLQWAFPELVWSNYNKPDYGKWEQSEYYLPGRRNIGLPDGFVRSIGTTSMDTGGRADIFLIDDLLSELSAKSITEVAYRCEWLRSILQQLESIHCVALLITNRWALDDPNSMIHDEMPSWSIWSRAAWVCGTHGRGNCGRRPSDQEHDECTPTEEPLWPERHDDLDAVRELHGDEIFFTQWGNRPQLKAELDVTKLIEFTLDTRMIPGEETGNPVRKLCVCIPEQRDHKTHEVVAAHEIIPIERLRGHYISIDPASADDDSKARMMGRTSRWAASWFAIDAPTGRVVWLACRADHWGPTDAIEHIYQLWREASGIMQRKLPFLCERVAAQTLVKAALKFRAQNDQITIHPDLVENIPVPRGIQKDDRIRKRYGWRLGQRKVLLRRGIVLPRIETRHFPTGSKDTLDTEAQYEEKALELQGLRRDIRSVKTRRAMRARQIANADRTGVW